MNNRVRKSSPGFFNFGFSTILLAFVMICIVTVAALSLLTANSDYKLSQKVAEKNSLFYAAEKQAYEYLAKIDDILEKAYVNTTEANDYYQEAEESLLALKIGTYDRISGTFMYAIPIAENQNLEVQLLIYYPTKSDESFYEIISWKSTYEQTEIEEGTLDLID